MKLRNKNTGKIVVIDSFEIKTPLMQVEIESLEELNEIIKELNGEWEDYTPVEPLIKDEKIRKAVRAWVDFNHSHELFVVSVSRIVDEKNNEIKFSGQPFCGLVSMQPTITELCGEEE